MIIIGIDPSLTGTGIARVDTDDRLYIDLAKITSTGSATATYEDKRQRLGRLVQDIDAHVLGLPYGDGIPAHLVVIEAPAMSKANAGTSMLNGLWWMLLARLGSLRVPVAVSQPTSVKKYAVGAGNASKGAVIDATTRRLPHAQHGGDDNLCDATWLAAMGADHFGTPLVELPKNHREALEKVAWPKVAHGTDTGGGTLMEAGTR